MTPTPSQFGKTRYVESDWQDALAASEAGDMDNWISFKGTDPISDVPGDPSTVYRIKTGRGNLVFKRFVPRSPWRYLLRQSRTSNEWAGLKAFRDAGFKTPELVASGEDRRWGGLKAGYIVTREIPGALDLASWYARNIHALDDDARRKETAALVSGIVGMVQRAHRKGLFHRDLVWRNILVTEAGGEREFWLIDCPRFTDSGVNRKHSALVDLAGLGRVALSVLSLPVRYRALLLYCDGDRIKARTLFREIMAHYARSKHPPRRFDPQTCTYSPFADGYFSSVGR